MNTQPSTALYSDLSGYYDLMCADINYQQQSDCVRRLHQMFGSEGKTHLDLACGTGPHVRFFIDNGYESSGLDLNQPMLDLAKQRCPEAQFSLQNMCDFVVDEPYDLITCFLYSIHYSGSLEQLRACIERVHAALKPAGVFCFNAVEKKLINNDSFVRHSVEHEGSHFVFKSGWFYGGNGDKQALKLSIEKTTNKVTEEWHDDHPMVAVGFDELTALLAPYFDVTILEHDYDKLLPWDNASGNAIFTCVKR
ncbi:SAM-dependent methyltransferase [Enterovibrio norvegicus FF-33]|uniref:SAM-dependent methyltransferase n=1 Tax=Enterovibrio norvegicus FF-454 TaxID=1185651 RepID=A0A1E5BVZ4_9GAMM|nr:SAM-dependent methyltransferase [Enterovibrio norvegicus FF-454]OEE67334.1 SAM-dependent methyltransferase [Enterovibrio norvegicus FF-33]OEE86527.1 SAM-dependent methyltransferase [Enterovibrio norvegicus FF-162]